MKAIQTTLHTFISESEYFRIPDFQRPYAWKSMQGEAFWDSLKDTVSNSKRHYFGGVVFFEEDDSRVVIDGQQRLTTTLLFLTACYHVLLGDSRKAWNHTAEELGARYLYNEDNGELKVTLRGATTDRKTFERILHRKTVPVDEQSKLYAMYEYFLQCIKDLDKIDPYIEILERIDMISISLQADDDNPQVIFENINATGEPLTDGDKIRNYALMLNTENARNVVYNDYWMRIEKTLTRSESFSGVGRQYITDFFKVFLTMHYGEKQVNDKNLYPTFKEYYREHTSEQSLETLKTVWTNISSVLDSYVYLKFSDDITEHKILSVFDDQEHLDITNNRYLLFFVQLLEFYKQNEITRNDFRNILDTLYKQVMRSQIVRKPFDLSNATAHTILKIHKDYETNSYFDAYLWYMAGSGDLYNAKDVSDKAIKEAITSEDMSDSLAYTLLKDLDRSYLAHNETVRTTMYSYDKLDRIMPKAAYGILLDDVWKEELGEKWETVNQRFFDKLANKVLVGYPIAKNRKSSYATKLETVGGIADAANYTTLQVAENYTKWDRDTFEDRTKWLREEIVKIYAIPRPLKSAKIKARETLQS